MNAVAPSASASIVIVVSSAWVARASGDKQGNKQNADGNKFRHGWSMFKTGRRVGETFFFSGRRFQAGAGLRRTPSASAQSHPFDLATTRTG